MLTKSEHNFSIRAIRRKKLFLTLSVMSVVIGLSMAGFYFWEAITQPNFDIGIHFLLVLLILLTAGQNLRQYNYAKILEKLISGDDAD